MKKSIVLGLLLSFCITSVNAQDFKPWNVGLNITSYNRYIILQASVNRDIGERFEIGIMPIFQYSKSKPSNSFYSQQESYGLNATGRYFIGRGTKLEPYVATIFGFGISLKESSYVNSIGDTRENSSQSNFFDAAILLGNELKIGKKGWIFDFNIGLLGTKLYDGYSDFGISPIYTFGVKKKFRNK